MSCPVCNDTRRVVKRDQPIYHVRKDKPPMAYDPCPECIVRGRYLNDYEARQAGRWFAPDELKVKP